MSIPLPASVNKAVHDEFDVRRCPPVGTVVMFFLFVCFKEFPLIAYGLAEADKYIDDVENVGLIALFHLLMQIIGIVCTFGHLAVRISKQLHKQDTTFQALDKSHCLQLGICFSFTISAILSMFHTVIELNDHPKTRVLENMVHDSHVDFFSLGHRIIYATYFVIVTPLLLSAIYHDALRDIFWILWVACVAAVLSSIGLIHKVVYGLMTGLFFVQIFILFYAARYNVLVIHLKDELRQKTQQERILKHDSDMKLMLANAAHDLKTPLASLVAGLDIIQRDLLNVQATFSNIINPSTVISHGNYTSEQSPPSPASASVIATSLACIQDMASTNHFMTMSINRCIEYAKSSRGLKLTPVYGHVHLLNTLALPLRVMRAIQREDQRINIELETISSDICSYIITDQQWLQENLLCLLSNAVKYSHRGVVQVRVKLVDCHGAGVVRDEADSSVHNADQGDGEDGFLASLNRISRVRNSGDKTSSRTGNRAHRNKAYVNTTASLSSLFSLINATTKVANAPDPPPSPAAIAPPSPHPAYLRVEVEDEGIGVSEEQRGKLFAPFSQTQTLASGSTGLGLYSLRMRVEALGGGVGVEGRLDGKAGSLFWFSLPYKPDPEHERLLTEVGFLELGSSEKASRSVYFGGAEADRTTQRASGITMSHTDDSRHDFDEGVEPLNSISSDTTTSSWCRVTSTINPHLNDLAVLLVDDSPAILKMTATLLEREGVAVGVAQNGAIAVEKVHARLEGGVNKVAYDCILMDLHMPVMDGLEAVRRLRAMEKQKETKKRGRDGANNHSASNRHIVIACSADLNETVMALTQEAGFDACLMKPVSMPVLFETLARLRNGEL